MDKKASVSGSMNSSNSNNLYKLSSNSNTNRTITQPTSTFKPLTTTRQQPNFISGFYNEELLDLVEEINK